MAAYVIESTARGTAKGGDWAGPWSRHTTLADTNLIDARHSFRQFIRQWNPEVRQYFRLTRYWGERITPLKAR